MQQRIIQTQPFQVREENGQRELEGYFSVFNKPYEVCPGWIEEIAPGAFTKTLMSGRDVKVLWNHNSDIVLGSTGNKTAYLSEDGIGLKGRNIINEDDQDAKNGYARVKRGDVTGCSFGFEIIRQETWWDDEGNYRTKLLEVELYEVSPCTFPAYEQTNISARATKDLEKAKEQLEKKKEEKREEWRARMLTRLEKGE